MKRKNRTDLILLACVILFSAGTLWLARPGEKETDPAAQKKAYYLTAYETPEDLLAVQITNETGKLTIVHHENMYITDTDLPGIEPDEETVSELFLAASRIRVGDPLEGADPKDGQFGLTEPASDIFVEDLEEKGIRFLIGNRTPDQSACYVCVPGGEEVYTLPAGISDLFLGDVSRYLDLRVFGDIDPASVTQIAVSDQKGQRFEISASGEGQITGAKYYSLTYPAAMPVALSRIREMFFASIEQLRAVSVSDGIPVGKELCELSLKTEAEEKIYRIGYTKDGQSGIWDTSSGFVSLVSELPEWLFYDAGGVLGGNLLSLNAANIAQITLEAGGKTAQYVFAADKAHPQLIGNLNRIPIAVTDGGSTANGKEILRCLISMRTQEQDLELVFYETGDRQCEISVNGKHLFTCAVSSLQPLLDQIAGSGT